MELRGYLKDSVLPVLLVHTEHNLAGFRPDSPVRNKISNCLIVSDLPVV